MPLLSTGSEKFFNQPHGGNIGLIAEYLGLAPQDITDFSAHLNPFGPPPEVMAALADSTTSIDRYPELGAESFVNALAEHLAIERECLLPGNGSAELLYSLAAWFKPRRALIIEPSFNDYHRAVAANGARVRAFYLDEDDGFALDLARFEAFMQGVDMVVLGRPNNPTGSLVDLDRLAHLIDRHPRALFIVDEAFIDFVEPPASIVHQATGRRNLIALRSLTKIYSIPGLRLGYLVAHRGTVSRLQPARPPWPLGAAQTAGGAVAVKLMHFVESSRRRLVDERFFFLSKLREFRTLQPFSSMANFILIKVVSPNKTGSDLTLSLAERGICVRDCASFSGLSDKYIRIAVKSREDNQRLIDALREVL